MRYAGIILDTNVISETMHIRPDTHVLRWFAAQQADALYLTSVTLAELWHGVERLPIQHPKRTGYFDGIVQTIKLFNGRILSFDEKSAQIWGQLVAQQANQGRTVSAMDMQIASLVLQHRMALATRNSKDFHGLGLQLINPFLAK